MSKPLRLALLVVWLGCCHLPAALAPAMAARGARWPASSNQGAESAQGKHAFETRCSACHGLDGRGGEHAPGISTDPIIQGSSDSAVSKIIRQGRPSKGMPAFSELAADEVQAIVKYMRFLAGRSQGVSLAGNPVRGKQLFFGEAACGHCHPMDGTGGFLGSDLTAYSLTHTPKELKAAVLDPEKLHERAQWVEIVTPGEQQLTGVLRNEDNFSLQILSADGTLHLLMKSEGVHLNRRRIPVMSAGGQRLSAGQIEDLVSYLTSAAPRTAVKPRGPTPKVKTPSASSSKPARST